MTVHFIGVGPGAEDLLTIRGKKLINKSPICMYAGSLISKKILKFCPKDAVIKNTAYMNLEQILSEFRKAEKKKVRYFKASFWRFIYMVSYGRTN